MRRQALRIGAACMRGRRLRAI